MAEAPVGWRRGYTASALLALILALFTSYTAAEVKSVKIGVLAIRGEQEALKSWTPTAQYLTTRLPGHSFAIVPLTRTNIDETVQTRAVDFVLVNPGTYVRLEVSHGATRVLTLEKEYKGKTVTQFGAVIIVRHDRKDIAVLSDLRGKSFMGIGKDAFGGFGMAWRELKQVGIDPFSDFSDLKFSGHPQDNIVYAVRDGKVDAGTVRTGALEQMAAEGKIDINEYRVINPQKYDAFPFAHSTRLYPEWAFARLTHTDNGLAQAVVIALLQMPANSPAAKASKSTGWTVPLDYTPVHDLHKELRTGPYANYGRMSTAEFIRAYWRWLAMVVGLFLVLSAIAFYIAHLNRVLSQSQTQLLKASRELERLSTHDDLTGIANHRFFQDRLDMEWRRARREHRPLALLMIDIDFFKAVNDASGHLAGDECLRQVAQVLAKCLRRPGDVVARYGGEEFVAILPGTDTDNAVLLAERVRVAVEALGLAHPASSISRFVTVSVGVASMVPDRQQEPDVLVAAADKAMYQAKENGRNRVEMVEK